MSLDDLLMRRALNLAESSIGLASPNPVVGCVLSRGETILGEGAHHYDRRDHAEIVALQAAAAAELDVQGATAYVTLEPCSHHGRTGPCADALIAARIGRVVVATRDPNPAVSGRGIARLRAAGIPVTLAIGQAHARRLNEAFALAITQHRPFVTLKSALSVDGFLAPPPAARTPGTPHWVSGPEARQQVQHLRHAADAILTGIGTVLADNPLLTDRTDLPRRRPLLRVVLDTQLRLPLTASLTRTIQNDLLILCSETALQVEYPKVRELESRGAQVLPLAAPLQPATILATLQELDIRSVLLEAGPAVNSSFLAANLVDRIVLYYAETELGAGSVPFTVDGPTSFALEQTLLQLEKSTIGPDVRVSGLLHNPWTAVAAPPQPVRAPRRAHAAPSRPRGRR